MSNWITMSHLSTFYLSVFATILICGIQAQVYCPGGQEWTQCTSACAPLYTCENWGAIACTEECREPGCQCPDNVPIFRDGKCISYDECSSSQTPLPPDTVCIGNQELRECVPSCTKTCMNKHFINCPVECNGSKCACPPDLPILDTNTGLCVKEENCKDPVCKAEQTWEFCWPSCDPTCKKPDMSDCPTVCDVPKCTCPEQTPIFDEEAEKCVSTAEECTEPRKCKTGMPAKDPNGQEIFCGRGPGRQECPPGYTCNIHPTDMYAVCCQDEDVKYCPGGQVWTECTSGCASQYTCENWGAVTCTKECQEPGCQCPDDRPIFHNGKCIAFKECQEKRCIEGEPKKDESGKEINCGLGPSSQICGMGYQCNVHPVDAWAVCCPEPKCKTGMPAKDLGGQEIFCGRGLNRQDCPPGYTCNIHPTDMYAVCCKDEGQEKCGGGKEWTNCTSACAYTCENWGTIACIAACQQPGCQCPSSMPIFHNGKCIAYEDCPDASKPDTDMDNICSNPKNTQSCAQSSNNVHLPRYYFNHKTQKCEDYVWNGCGGNRNTFVTKDLCQSACEKICEKKPESGPCEAAMPRWYYDNDSEECREFMYGGCDGNGNNFNSKEACLNYCGKSNVPDGGPKLQCTDPQKIGPCEAAISRYYYDLATKQCRNFLWGGCEPNGNNFITVEDCTKTCVLSEMDRCKMPPEKGPCEDLKPRWYYKDGLCKVFNYGGCGGNANNFVSYEECTAGCDTMSASSANTQSSLSLGLFILGLYMYFT